MRGLQHLVVVGVDRNIGVHIAVTGVHMQRSPDPPAQRFLVHAPAFSQDRLEGNAAEDALQRLENLCLPGSPQRMVLQLVEKAAALRFGARQIKLILPLQPLRAYFGQQRQGLFDAVAEQLGAGDRIIVLVLAQRQLAMGETALQGIDDGNLVAQTQLDIDALDAQRVLAHAWKRDHHVFIDLERIGMLGDRGGALAVEPEFLARIGRHSNKAFTMAAVGQAHDLAGGKRHRIGVVADDVADQDHLG